MTVVIAAIEEEEPETTIIDQDVVEMDLIVPETTIIKIIIVREIIDFETIKLVIEQGTLDIVVDAVITRHHHI